NACVDTAPSVDRVAKSVWGGPYPIQDRIQDRIQDQIQDQILDLILDRPASPPYVRERSDARATSASPSRSPPPASCVHCPSVTPVVTSIGVNCAPSNVHTRRCVASIAAAPSRSSASSARRRRPCRAPRGWRAPG